MQNLKIKRITAWVAIIAIVLVMLFSVMFISEHADHECSGAECQICSLIDQCLNSFKNIKITAILLIAASFISLFIQKNIQYFNDVCSCCSLISQKIRINN